MYIIQFDANPMNKSQALIDFVKFYTDPAFIHLVCFKLYFWLDNRLDTTKLKCTKLYYLYYLIYHVIDIENKLAISFWFLL